MLRQWEIFCSNPPFLRMGVVTEIILKSLLPNVSLLHNYLKLTYMRVLQKISWKKALKGEFILVHFEWTYWNTILGQKAGHAEKNEERFEVKFLAFTLPHYIDIHFHRTPYSIPAIKSIKNRHEKKTIKSLWCTCIFPFKNLLWCLENVYSQCGSFICLIHFLFFDYFYNRWYVHS